MVAKSISKPRVETSVKSEPVDIKSEQLDVVAIKTEPRDKTFINNLTFRFMLFHFILIFWCSHGIINKFIKRII